MIIGTAFAFDNDHAFSVRHLGDDFCAPEVNWHEGTKKNSLNIFKSTL